MIAGLEGIILFMAAPVALLVAIWIICAAIEWQRQREDHGPLTRAYADPDTLWQCVRCGEIPPPRNEWGYFGISTGRPVGRPTCPKCGPGVAMRPRPRVRERGRL